MMQSGTIKFFDARRGFGFILPDIEGPDVYFYKTALPYFAHHVDSGVVVRYELGTRKDRQGNERIIARKVKFVEKGEDNETVSSS